MGVLAFTIAGAAQAAATTEPTILQAIRAGALIVRRTPDDRAIIVATDLQQWLEGLPVY